MKYVPGLMVGQLSGKAGSTVASRNKGGSYFRTRVIPKHVVNEKTTAVRASFGEAAQRYRSLTESQRAAWDSLGAQITRKTSLGETIHLTGIQALVLISRNLYSLEASYAIEAPAFESAPTLNTAVLSAVAGASLSTTVVLGANSATQHVTSSADMFVGQTLYFATANVFREVVTVTDGTHVVLNLPVNSTTAEVIDFTGLPTMSIAIDPDPSPAGAGIIVECTAPLSAGVSRPSRGQFRQVVAYASPQASPLDIALLYVQTFGQPVANSKVFVRLKLITGNGFAGPELATFALVS